MGVFSKHRSASGQVARATRKQVLDVFKVFGYVIERRSSGLVYVIIL